MHQLQSMRRKTNLKRLHAANPAVLPTVVVKDTGKTTGYVTTHTMSGTKTDTPIIEIPQSISVINRNEMDMRGVQLNFTEALRYVPGVVADQFGFNGTGFRVSGHARLQCPDHCQFPG